VIRHLTRHPFVATYIVAVAARLALAAFAVGRAGDTARYKAAAEALRSSPLTGDAAFVGVPPLFPTYLALIPNDTIALVLQIAIASLVAPIVGMATTRHFGRTAGTVAAILAALEPSLIVWSTFLLTDSFAALFFAIGLDMTSRTLASGSFRSAFAAGMSLGFSSLARAAFVVAAAAFVLFPILSPERRPARGIVVALGFTLILAVPATRNLVAIGEPTVYRSPTWELIWLGTMWNEVGRGTIGVDLILPPGYLVWSSRDQGTFARTEAVRIVTENPTRFVLLTMKKVLWFWLPAYPEWSLPHKVLSGGYFVALYVAAVLGLAYMRHSMFAWLLVASIVALVIPVALTLVDYDARYRLPVEVCLLPLAAAGSVLLAKRLRDVAQRPRVAP
jgi:4-amino-4-deoxy-L-arabinose transferase-like glycosyltransferase